LKFVAHLCPVVCHPKVEIRKVYRHRFYFQIDDDKSLWGLYETGDFGLICCRFLEIRLLAIILAAGGGRRPAQSAMSPWRQGDHLAKEWCAASEWLC
jgi:hypothetical protein